jgi:hypothetical protein
VDLDADGKLDVLSGSWPGELYFFRGLGQGRFAAGITIKDKDGKVIRRGNASTVFATDWNGDGRLDLLIGNIEGQIFLAPDLASQGKNSFGSLQELKVAAKPIRVPHGDSHPTVADWDSDGSPDLVVGAGDGSVLWYRNAGTRSEPSLSEPQVLLQGTPPEREIPRVRSTRPGMRAKVCVTDWNGDGTLDLLVGDMSMSQAPPPQLSAAERAAETRARKEMDAAMKDLRASHMSMRRLGPRPTQSARRARWERQMKEVRTQQSRSMTRLQQSHRTMARFRPPYNIDGFVWLLTPRPAAVALQR